MWIDHFLFWSVLVWMLLLAVLVSLSVRALLRDERADDDSPAHEKPIGPDTPPENPKPLPRP